MAFRHPILFATVLIVALFPHKLYSLGKPAFSNYEFCVTEDGTFGLYKPKGWKVNTQRYPNGRMVFVTDPGDLCFASMTFLDSIDPKHDAVTFAGATMKNIKAEMPGLSIVEARSSRDRMHTVVKYERGHQTSNRIEGKYTFNVKHPTSVVFGYEAPAQQFREMVPTLLTIIANMTVLDDQAYQRIASQQKGQGQAILPMKSVSAADGTCSLMVPDGWTFTAGNGRALCASPDGDTGFNMVKNN